MGSRPRQGDEHPTYALLLRMARLPLPDFCEIVKSIFVDYWPEKSKLNLLNFGIT